MATLAAVDKDLAEKARAVLAPFRWTPGQTPVAFDLDGGVLIGRERADALELEIQRALEEVRKECHS